MIPDITGYVLSDAIKIITGQGYDIHKITAVSPPRHESTAYDESYRILDIRIDKDNKLELLVCFGKDIK